MLCSGDFTSFFVFKKKKQKNNTTQLLWLQPQSLTERFVNLKPFIKYCLLEFDLETLSQVAEAWPSSIKPKWRGLGRAQSWSVNYLDEFLHPMFIKFLRKVMSDR